MIDEIGTFKKIGKTPGKDLKQGKSTLLRMMGEKNVIYLCEKKVDQFKKKNKAQKNLELNTINKNREKIFT